MAKRPVSVSIKDYSILQKQLEQMQKAPEQVINSTLAEARVRIPGWVSTEVAKVYNVKSEKLQPGEKSLGGIRVKADDVSSIRVTYSGRLLTPYHFALEPKTPQPSYTLKHKVYKKGRAKTLGKVKTLTQKQKKNLVKNFTGEGTQKSERSPIMLMHTGNKREGGIDYIPFQRVSKNRKELHVIKTTSLPQMIDNKTVRPNIDKRIEENIGKRFDHYMKRYVK